MTAMCVTFFKNGAPNAVFELFVKTDLSVELKRFLATKNPKNGGDHPSSLAGY